jgi:hypothetical protein
LSTTSLTSDSLEVPQSKAGTGAAPIASELDHIEAQIQALKQQALATQAGIGKLQNSFYSDTASISNTVPAQPNGSPDTGIWFSVAGIVLLLMVPIWAFQLWMRRGSQHAPADALNTAMPELSGESEFAHYSRTSLEAVAQDEWLSPKPVAAPESNHQPAQSPQPQPNAFGTELPLEASAALPPHPENEPPEPPPEVQWDSLQSPEATTALVPPSVTEAVANEVVRVRNVLADKRLSRSLGRQQESLGAAHPSDVLIDMLNGAMQFDAPPDVFLPLSPSDAPKDLPDEVAMETDPGQLFEEPLDVRAPARVANTQNPAISAGDGLDLELELELDIPTTPDFGVRLALAQESEALGLWQEARELALEVMECSDPELRSQAKTILNRLKQQQQEI